MRVVIVGAGPAGMAAALELSKSVRPVVVDALPTSGGQIWRGSAKNKLHIDFETAVRKGRITHLSGAEVFDAVGQSLLVHQAGRAMRLDWDHLVLACGAREVLLPFPGWTLPGVFGLGGFQLMVKGGLDIRGRRIALAGTGPLIGAAAETAWENGARSVVVFESAPWMDLARLGAAALAHPEKRGQLWSIGQAMRRSSVRLGDWVVEARGDDRVTSIVSKTGWQNEVDFLACGWSLAPNLELARLLELQISDRVETDPLGRTSSANIWAIGEQTGIGGAAKSAAEGQLCGAAILDDRARINALMDCADQERKFADLLKEIVRIPPQVKEMAKAAPIFCRCENAPLPIDGAESKPVKLTHRIGMGPCQGKVCGLAGHQALGWESPSIRPPLFPVSARVLAQGWALLDQPQNELGSGG